MISTTFNSGVAGGAFPVRKKTSAVRGPAWLAAILLLPASGFAALLCLAASPVAFAANTPVDINSTFSGKAYGNSNDGGATANLSPVDSTLNINSGGLTTNPVYGGYNDTTANIDARGNVVDVKTGGAVTGNVYGAFNTGNFGTATGNTAYVAGTVTIDVYGAYALSHATGNIVNITDGSVSQDVYGGKSEQGYATGNFVNISGGSVARDVYGGQTWFFGSSLHPATGNTVTISGSPTLSGTIYGGYALSHDSFTGNTLDKNSSATVVAAQNFEFVNFGYSGNANINNLDTTPTRAAGAPLVKLNTGGSSITFNGVISGNGGIAKTGAGTLTLSGVNTYTGLTTVQGGTLELGSGTGSIGSSSGLTLYGGSTFRTNGQSHTLDGKTLSVRGQNATYDGNLHATGATLNFIAPVSVSQPLLNVTGTADITGSAVNVGVSGGTSLPKGTQLTLIQTAPGNLTDNNLTQGSGIVEAGVTTIYGLSLTPDPLTGLLRGTVTSGGAAEQAKALSEGFLGGAVLVNQGADLVAGQGMSEAVSAARRHGRGSFGALSGGSLRYDTGSHVDMNSLSLMAGLSYGAALKPGNLALGAFFEYGNGAYDSYNAFSNAASVHGDGDIDHMGGGILGRMDFSGSGPGHFYAEASGRAGRVHNEYSSADLRDSQGRKADYDSSAAYYGIHAGAGYLWKITDKASLDLSGKYFWTRQAGDSVRLSTGEKLRFKDVDSSRLRLGVRYAHVINEYLSPYAGAAYEHEFDGKARASSNGFAIDAPSLRGDTGIGELGLSLKPSPSLPLSFDLGVQGYVGKREGVTGSLQARWAF